VQCKQCNNNNNNTVRKCKIAQSISVPASDGLTQVSCVFALLQEDAVVNVLKLNCVGAAAVH